MKQGRWAAALLCLALALSSCGRPAATEAEAIAFPFAEWIGYGREVVVEEMHLEGAAQQGPHELRPEDTVPLLGREYAQLLTFLDYEQYEDILGGGVYAIAIPDYTQEDLAHAFSLAEAMTGQYGAPSTYPGFSDTITGLDAASFSEGREYLERWAVEGVDFLEMEMRLYAQDGTLTIRLGCQIAGEAVRNNSNGEAEHLDGYLSGIHGS